MTQDDSNPLAPFILAPYDEPDRHFLMLSDNHMVEVMDVFEEHGQYGNGYGWEAIARQVIRGYAPELEGRFDFDPEAGTFVANSPDRDALEALGALMQGAFHDRLLLAEIIQGADADWFD